MLFILTLKTCKRVSASLCCLCLFFMVTASAGKSRLEVLNPADISQWTEKEFAGQTHYEQYKTETETETETETVIKAQSRASASGLFREIHIDLNKTPYLNWRWKVENTLGQVDETSKHGDDYPARIYVVISGGFWFWKTRALNYVWSSKQPVNSEWPNAFTSNAHMLAVDSGKEKLNTWVQHRRNVLQDIKTYLKLDNVEHIDAVAIMTDTDNSGQEAVAYYGEVYFSD